MHFNPYSIPPFVTAIINLWLGIVVYSRNKKSQINQSFFLLSLSIVVWLIFASITYNCSQKELAMIFIRMSHLGVAYISITMFHFIVNFLNITKLRKLVIFFYCYGLVCSALFLFTNLLTSDCKQYFWGFYSLAGKLHPAFLIIFIAKIILCVYLLLTNYIKLEDDSLRKQQIKYVFIGIFIFDFSSVDFIPNYGISFYPFGYVTTTLFFLAFAYSIIKYRLLDISIAITRTGIFIAVYSFVLGIPFAIAFGWQKQLLLLFGSQWWLTPLFSMAFFATVGPFIYFYIQKKAEDRLLQEQYRYQTTLRQASAGMGRIKDLNRLVNLIVHIVTRTVRIEHSIVYINDSLKNFFVLGACRAADRRFRPKEFIESKSKLIEQLRQTKAPIVYEEIKQRTQDYGDLALAHLEAELKELNAALVFPSFIEDKLLAIIILGKKLSGRPYSDDDLNVFSILANQAALAIENAQFYEDVKKTHEQLYKAEKMATIGTMADGLSHQINNRLHALGFIASDVLDTIKLKRNLAVTPELKEMLVDIEHGLTRIQENVTQGGEIVRGLLKYTRKGEEGFAEVDLNQLLDSAVEMTQFKIKSGEMTVVREFGGDVPKIKGNFTQLQEVFFNLIDNAYDAMMQRKHEFKESDYEATIRISTEGSDNGHLKILVADNGIGIKDDDRNKLFTPFFTTKLSSKKGTGLGLYVIRKLIEENHGGKVVYDSKYKQGTKVTLSLPIYNHS